MSQRQKLMGRCYFLAKELGLTKEERQELAMMIPSQWMHQTPLSWSRLSDADLVLMAAWLRGAMLVEALRGLRPPIKMKLKNPAS